MKAHRMALGVSSAVAVFLTVLAGLLTANEWEAAAPMSEDAKAATAKLKTISESTEAGDLAEIERLIEAGADVNLRNCSGVTPLMMASQNGHTEVVNLLLANNADVNAADKTNGVTALWMASHNGHTKVVKLLLANKAEVNAAHTDGRTPLWLTAHTGRTEGV